MFVFLTLLIKQKLVPHGKIIERHVSKQNGQLNFGY